MEKPYVNFDDLPETLSGLIRLGIACVKYLIATEGYTFAVDTADDGQRICLAGAIRKIGGGSPGIWSNNRLFRLAYYDAFKAADGSYTYHRNLDEFLEYANELEALGR